MEQPLQQIEVALDQFVRPKLTEHRGNLVVESLEDGVLYIRMTGQCAGCLSADDTTKTLVEAELVKALPELVKEVVCLHTVSNELWAQAMAVLKNHGAPGKQS